MKKRQFAVILCLAAVAVSSFLSLLNSLIFIPNPKEEFQVVLNISIFSYICILLPIFCSCFAIFTIFYQINMESLGQPKPEAYLKNYAGKKLKVLASHGYPPHPRVNFERYATVFYFEESSESKIKLSSQAIIYCYTSEFFQKDENIEIKYDPQFRQLGYYDERCLRRKVEIL